MPPPEAPGLLARLRAALAGRPADADAILADEPLFDPAWYRRHAMAEYRGPLSPAEHYLAIGTGRGAFPHALFDPGWYRARYAPEGDPLLHYMRLGRAAGLRPNEFLDPAWYLREYPDVAGAGLEPVGHWMHHGVPELRNPSAEFSTDWYLQTNPGSEAFGGNPLVHYLHRGRAAGMLPTRRSIDWAAATPVTDAPIECRKQPTAGLPERALFVTHSPDGAPKPHLRHYLQCLAAEGVAVTLIVAVDAGFAAPGWLPGLVDGLYVRANRGWDFAAWAHAMRLDPGLRQTERLFWLNDSVVGPVTADAFAALMRRVRASTADVIGLTANKEEQHHLQSYFLVFRRPALQASAFHGFVDAIRSLRRKQEAVFAYETQLSPTLNAAGLRTEALWQPGGPLNPTLHEWRRLLDEGFPFLKVAAMAVDAPAWAVALRGAQA